jgi:molybdopterin converting factor small subunit
MSKSVGRGRKELLFLILRMVALNYYGVLTDLSGMTSDNVNISEGSTFSELKDLLEKRYPEFAKYSIVFFQKSNYCTLESTMLKGFEIDCMPPFSGG